MTNQHDLQIDTACKVSEEFTKLFFEAFDQKRHTLNKFYLETATLSWDGNPAIGKDAIQKFFETIPLTTHTLTALDAQPVSIEAVKGQQTVLVHVAGTIKVAKERTPISFTESFVITAEGGRWKIVTDCCRLQVPLSAEEKT